MRKRTINHFAETIFWNVLYFVPIIAFLILTYTQGAITLSSVFGSIGLDIAQNSIAFTTLSQIFGVDGILPLFVTTDVLVFLTYYVNIFIAHIFVDFILFIPKLAKKWLNKFTQGDE